MSDIQVLQNKAAHIFLDFSYRPSASAALERLSWINLKIRRKLHRLIVIYKCMIHLFLRYHQDFHGYNSRSKFCQEQMGPLDSTVTNGIIGDGVLTNASVCV